MENNLNFKKLWNEQNIAEPNLQELFDRLKKYRQKNLFQIIISNILLISTTIFIICVWYLAQPQLLTTKIGIALTILAIFIFLVVYNKQIPIFKKLNESNNNKNYLADLLSLQLKQKNLHSKMTSLYFFMLSFGIGLYMIEYVAKMPLWAGIVCYIVVAVWLLVNWFYLRPKTIAKQQGKLNELIEQFYAIQKQIKE